MRTAMPYKGSIVFAAISLALLFVGHPASIQPAEAFPQLSSASPNPAVAAVGGSDVAITMRGTGMDQITAVAVVRNKQNVPGIAVTLGAPAPASRQVIVRANPGTPAGDAQLRLYSGNQFVDIPLNVFRIAIPMPAVMKPATTQTMQAAGAARGAARPQPFTEVTTYPGARFVRTAAIGVPPAATGLRAVRQDGVAARGIDLRLGQDPRMGRFIDIITRADAAAGRYGMEFFMGGKWVTMQPGGFGLTIVPPQGSMTPLGAMTGIINTRTGHGTPPVPGPGSGIGMPGAQTDARNIGSQFGLTNPQDNPKGDLTRPAGVGDSRLMAGGAVNVKVTMTDVQHSDGSQHVKQVIETTDANGNTSTDTMEANVDANGNSTETQTIETKDKDGNVTGSSTSTGSSTPNPEKAGCTTEQCRQQMQWATQVLAPLVKRMQDFYMAKFTSLRGDGREGTTSSGNRPVDGAMSREGLPKAGSGAIDPNPEKGGSSGSSPFGTIQQTGPVKDLKGTLPDPVEGVKPGHTAPPLPPGTKPDTGGGPGSETGGGPTPYPAIRR